jgi:hypothetical protein
VRKHVSQARRGQGEVKKYKHAQRGAVDTVTTEVTEDHLYEYSSTHQEEMILRHRIRRGVNVTLAARDTVYLTHTQEPSMHVATRASLIHARDTQIIIRAEDEDTLIC